MRKIVNHPYLFFNFHHNKISVDAKFQKKGHFGVDCIKRMNVDTLPEYKAFLKKKRQQIDELYPSLSVQERHCNIVQMNKEAEAQLVFKDWQLSGKLTILVKFLNDWNNEMQSNKVLIFSQTKKILDILELILNEKKIFFCRMDGDVPLKQRMDTIQTFNIR